MKVYIGPYRDFHINVFRPLDKYMTWKHKKPYWSIDDDEYTKSDKFLEKIFDKINDLFNGTIHKITERFERKVKVRIDPYDTWSMDHTLALIIHPMLIQLKETNHGFGYVDPEDVPHIGKGEEIENENDSFTESRWNWVMDEMIWTFEHLKDDNSYDLFYSEVKGWDREAMNAHEERIKNGLRLFGKYFRALWD